MLITDLGAQFSCSAPGAGAETLPGGLEFCLGLKLIVGVQCWGTRRAEVKARLLTAA